RSGRAAEDLVAESDLGVAEAGLSEQIPMVGAQGAADAHHRDADDEIQPWLPPELGVGGERSLLPEPASGQEGPVSVRVVVRVGREPAAPQLGVELAWREAPRAGMGS